MDTASTGQPSPFHPGERAVQARLGVLDIEAWARQVVRDHLPDQHRRFHTALPFLVIAARDDRGRPWPTLLEGPDGFVSSPDDRHLVISALPAAGDALDGALQQDADIGILGIELATRRRNRVNGRVGVRGPADFTLRVDQTFGNCPQYIRERGLRRVAGGAPARPVRGRALTPTQRRRIARADTFFIASGYRGDGEDRSFGMDASHRGGEPGFVEVLDDRRIRFPDFAGNNHYNTIGNLQLDPRVGLLFVDFATGGLLQLTGTATIDWDSAAVARVPGARRVVTIEVDAVVERPAALGLRWDRDADSIRALRLVDKTRESDDVTSFLFEARDGGPLPGFLPGQHLPIELRIPGTDAPVRRTYSLSGPPDGTRYRISVKREPRGLASRHLHDRVAPGATLDARRPAGDFVLTGGNRPLVLVAAGIGITPLLSMLHAAAGTAGRRVWLIHGVRDGRHHPLAREVRELTAARPGLVSHVAYSRPGPADRLGGNHDSVGRVTGTLVTGLVQDLDADHFLCGPTGFMAGLQADLERRGVPARRIHTETFGPR